MVGAARLAWARASLAADGGSTACCCDRLAREVVVNEVSRSGARPFDGGAHTIAVVIRVTIIGRAISVAVRAAFHNGKDEVAVIVTVQIVWHSVTVAVACMSGMSVSVWIRRFELGENSIAVVVWVQTAINPVFILVIIEASILISILIGCRDLVNVVAGVEIIRNADVVAITSIGRVVIFIQIVGLDPTPRKIPVVVHIQVVGREVTVRIARNCGTAGRGEPITVVAIPIVRRPIMIANGELVRGKHTIVI
jgi:hypothetical protein